MNLFQIADGSVVGRNHVGRGNVLTGRNSQDAFCQYRDALGIVLVVTDGCGSTPYSEFGARLMANLVCRDLVLLTNLHGVDPTGLSVLYGSVLNKVNSVTATLCSPAAKDQFIRDHLLCTIVAAIVTPNTTSIVAIGDGCFALNGEFCSLDIFESRPPYLAYGLLPPTEGMRRESYQFSLVAQIPTARLQSLMIGTDGVEDLRRAALKLLPGRTDRVGPLSQFWTDDIYFDNPVAIDRKLHRANSEHKRFNPGLGRVETFQGLLPDDTTMLVLRRTP